MPQEVAIIRKEIIIVDTVVPKTYQGATTGIIVTGKDGKIHSIGEKHKSLWNVFAPGLAVEAGYAEFRKDGVTKEYIHTARQVKDAIRPPAAAPVNGPSLPPQTVTQPKDHLVQAVKAINGDTKDRGVALSYAKDLVAAGKVELKDIFHTADNFLKYILNK